MKVLAITGQNRSKSNRGMDVIAEYFIDSGKDVTTYVFPITIRTKRYADNPLPNHEYAKYLPLNYYERFMARFPAPVTKLLFSFVIRMSNRIVFDEYDLIILESGTCVALVDALPEHVPLIYRQSDPVDGIVSKNKYLIECERKILDKADMVLTVSDAIHQKYVNEGYENARLWKNGFQATSAIEWPNPFKTSGVKAVYFGLYPVDQKLLRKIAQELPDIEFHIIGPHQDKVRCRNVVFHGYLDLDEYSGYLQHSNFAIVPYLPQSEMSLFPVTSKMYQFLDHRLPIVALAIEAIEAFSNETRDVYPCATPADFIETIKELDRVGYPFYEDYDLGYYAVSYRKEELKMILAEIMDVYGK